MNSQQVLAHEENKLRQEEWSPFPGPQTLAMTSDARENLVGGGRGGGKSSRINSLVMTPKGWVRMGDVSIGQLISDPTTGTQCHVIGVYPQGVKDIYRITCDDGAQADVTLDHLWSYKLPNRERPRQNLGKQAEISRSLLGQKMLVDRWNRFKVGSTETLVEAIKRGYRPRIPLTEPLAFTVPSLAWNAPMPPYLIGLMLGDGSLGSITMCTYDQEIREYLSSIGFNPSGKEVDKFGGYVNWTPAKLRPTISQWLGNRGLRHARSWEKFLPEYILTAPIDFRMEVLQGLMDTDGTVEEDGKASFCSTSPKLIEGVRALVRSLGGKAFIRTKHPTYTYKGEKMDGREAYETMIQLPVTSAAFRLSRKRARCTDRWNGGYEILRAINSIEKVGEDEAQCIAVSNPYGLYVTDDYIVTHNTELQLMWLARLAVEHDANGNLKYPTYKGSQFRLKATELRDWHKRAHQLYCGKLGARTSGQPTEYRFPGGPVIRSGHLEHGGYANYQGWEIHKMGIDEATHLPTTRDRRTGEPECTDYKLLLASLRLSPDGNSQVFLTGNPGPHPGVAWVKHRFIDVTANGVRIPPGTKFIDPVTGHSRMFVQLLLQDNPWILQNDPGYVRGLMENSEAVVKAWVYGDWDSFEGQFFDFDPEVHVVDPNEVKHLIPGFVYRWGSFDWGYAHPAAFYAHAQGLDGRVHTYKELSFEGKVGSFEIGTEIAKTMLPDLYALPDHQMSIACSHDIFRADDEGDRRVEVLAKGIRAVLGPESVFVLQMNKDEEKEAERDPESATRMMNARRQAMSREYGIVLVRAEKNTIAVWNYVHEMLRHRQVSVKGQPDPAVIEKLRKHPNGEAFVRNYLSGFGGGDEILPKAVIHSTCKKLIETMLLMVSDPDNPEDLLKVDGDDYVDAYAHGLSAHRNMQNQMPLAYYVADQIRKAFYDGKVDMTTAHFVNVQAQEKYKKQFAAPGPMRLGRAGLVRP